MSENSVTPEKKSFGAKVVDAILPVERRAEVLAAGIMMGLENMHDMNLVPQQYRLRREEVGDLFVPDDPVVRWAVDHIGDIWEISVGHTALRYGFAAVNEVLKKTTGKEIPDDACFWASLVTTVTIKAVHSLGYISLFGIHDHMDQPVPGMLFGQAVAAVVLASAHYASKYHEPIGDLARRTIKKVKTLGQTVADFPQKIHDSYMGVKQLDLAVSQTKEDLNN